MRDAAVGPARVGGQRVGAPVVEAVDDEADAQVLARLVALPLPAGLDDDGRRRRRSRARCARSGRAAPRGPQRVDQLEVVVGQQRREERAHRAQHAQAPARDLRPGAALSHAVRSDENDCQPYVLNRSNCGLDCASWRLPSRRPSAAAASASSSWPPARCSTSGECSRRPIEEIAQAVGIARGLIYRQFASKEELFVLTVTDYLAELGGGAGRSGRRAREAR